MAQDPVFWEIGQTERGEDILLDPQQMNSYSYARNNPIILTDPTGEITREIKDYLLATLYFTVQVVSAMV